MWMHFFLTILIFIAQSLKLWKLLLTLWHCHQSQSLLMIMKGLQKVWEIYVVLSQKQKKCRYQISHFLGSISFASLKIFSFKGFHITRFNFKGRWEAWCWWKFQKRSGNMSCYNHRLFNLAVKMSYYYNLDWFLGCCARVSHLFYVIRLKWS